MLHGMESKLEPDDGLDDGSDDESNFNQPLNNWDVSNVTNMEDMFYDE